MFLHEAEMTRARVLFAFPLQLGAIRYGPGFHPTHYAGVENPVTIAGAAPCWVSRR